MGRGTHDREVDASTTAVQSLLRELDEAAAWQDRPASRVRRFAHARPADDHEPVRDEPRARHVRRAI